MLASLVLAVFAPVVLGLATDLLPKQWTGFRAIVAFAGMLASFLVMLRVGLTEGFAGEVVAIPGLLEAPLLNLELSFRADQLGAFFAMLVAGVGALITLYARGYFGPDAKSIARFYPTLGLFATAMIGIALSDNMLGMFIFWELTTVSSFLLIGWNLRDKGAVKLALQALSVTGAGGMALLAGILVLGSTTGAWSFSALEAQGIGLDAAIVLAFVFLFIGAAAKSAQWPLHFWLPGAMAAPTPVSAYLHSATMVKAGVYLLARLWPSMHTLESWGPTLAWFGAITMLLGGVLAVRSNGLKKILAYTTVSQLGLLVCMYGVGGLEIAKKAVDDGHGGGSGMIWPVVQILNHALYKAPLFIIAGAIIHATGSKTTEGIRGLWRSHRVYAVVLLLGAFALAGMPGSLSFSMKEAFFYLLKNAWKEHAWVMVIGAMGVATAACNVTIFVRFVRYVFGGAAEPAYEHAHDDEHAHESGFWSACLWWPAALLVSFQIMGGVAPPAFEFLFGAVETNRGQWAHLADGSLLHAITHPGIPLLMTGIAIGAGFFLGLATRFPNGSDIHDRAFPAFIGISERLGALGNRYVQGGNLRLYIATILGAFALALGFSLTRGGGLEPLAFDWGSGDTAGTMIAVIMIGALTCVSALLMPAVRSRIVRVLLLGAAGFCATGMYLVYRAPDLALTQIMFEIISVVLFLLVMRLLPEDREADVNVRKLPRAVFATLIAIPVGLAAWQAGAIADRTAVGTDLALQASAAQSVAVASKGDEEKLDPSERVVDLGEHPRLGAWFLEHSYEGSVETNGRGGAGENVVNVILVDFRGYDTIGEITVLAIAVMGVLGMLAAVPRRPHEHAQPGLRSSLFRSAMGLILPLSLIFVGYVFFKGHNQPGGGFIAGLIASVAIAIYRVSEGLGSIKRLMPVKPATLAAGGLLIALATAILVPFLVPSGGTAFLTTTSAYVPLLGGDSFHFTSAMFFDLGVFLVVVGVSVGIINRFEEELE
ncbi:MAG: hydrogen gas-evolving membrane-bound hydrogenase subunit E [Planctomycetota bacterium]